METYEWVVIPCALIVILGWLFWTVKSATKAVWQVVLKDGTKFIGRKTLKTIWQEGFFESAYKVIDSLDSPFQKGTIVHLGWGTKLYCIRVK